MAETVVLGLAGLIITVGFYVSSRRNPRRLDGAKLHRHHVVLGVTAASFASAIASAVAAEVLQ